MIYSHTAYQTEVEILRNDHFATKAITLDFSGVTDTENGIKVIKAGTPVGANGKKELTNMVGILWKNAYETNPNAAVIIHGFIDRAKAVEASGIATGTYPTAATVATALPMVALL